MAEIDKGLCSNDGVLCDKDSTGKSVISGIKHINGLCITEKLGTEDNHVISKKEVDSVILNGEHTVSETGDNSKCFDQPSSKPSSRSETPEIDKNHVQSEDTYSNGISNSSNDTIVNGCKPSLLLAKARDSLKDIQAKYRTTPNKTDDSSVQEPEITEKDSLNHIENVVEENGVSRDILSELNKSSNEMKDKVLDCDESEHINDIEKTMIDDSEHVNDIEKTMNVNGSLGENENKEDIENMVVNEGIDEEEILENNDKTDQNKSEKVKEDELLGSNIEEGIHMEIGSDNEDDLLMMPEEPISEDNKKVGKTSPVSSEKDMCISFDEDSNSNMNTDKVNDAIKLLSHDLSGTQSPMPASEQQVPENEVIELNDSDLDVNKVNEKLSEVEAKSSEQLIDKEDDKVNEDQMETESVKDESKEIVEIEISPEKSPRSIENKDQVENTESESKNDDDEEEDDDVIFKGESKVENSSKETPNDENHQASSYKNEDIKEEPDSKISNPDEIKEVKSVGEDQNENNKEINAIEINDDDDVIFEKETKIDISDKNTNEPHNDDKSSKESVSVDSSKEIKSDEKTDVVTISKEDLTVNDSKTCDINDRKRPAEETELKTSAIKRSKLNDDKEIPSVKDSKVVQATSIELSDSDEGSDSSSNESNVPKSRETYLRLKKKKEEKKMITISKKELEDLVRTKVKEYLASQRDKLLTQLSQKCQDCQSNNDLWKRQVKDLQVKVNDVTVLQQKQEKRKAHTAALRQITTRNVGVQVDDGRTSNAKQKQTVSSPAVSTPTKLVPKPSKSIMAPVVTAPPGANGMIRLPIPQSSLPSPVLQQSLPQSPQIISQDFKTPTVKSLLGTTRTQPTISSVTTTSGTASTPVLSVQYPQRVVAHTPTSSATIITLSPNSVPSTANKVVKTSGNAKIIDLTDDEPSRMLVSIPQAMSGVSTQTGVQTIISPNGSQIVRPGTFQLVLGPGTQPLRPGTIVTGLPQTFIQTLPGSGAAPLNSNVNPQPSQPALTTVTNRVPPPVQTSAPVSTARDILPSLIHPAPFPPQPSQPSAPKAIPPKPSLRVSRTNQGIVLSWNMSLSNNIAEISSYQLFAYQETSAPPHTSLWKKVGDVKALPLPMACTLTQFQVGNKYHFAVRALDVHGRVSLYSDPSSLHMTDSNSTEK